MGTYPIKILSDEQGTPFVPLVSSDSVQTADGEKLTDLIDAKLSPEDLVGGQYVEITQEDGNVKINVDLPASLNTINNLTTETSGQGALDAYQGKVLKDSIPVLVDALDSEDANKALSARQGKILSEMAVPNGGKAGQVLKKATDDDRSFEWGDAADPNAIVGDGSIMSIISLTYAEYKKLEAEDKIQEDTEYHITDVSGAVISGGGSGVDLEEVQRMIDESIEEVAVPAGGNTGQVLKKSTNDDYDLEWGDAADPNAISGDGTIKKIVEISYQDYLKLKDADTLDASTEYHISDWNENEKTYLTTQEIEEIIYEKISNHVTETQVTSMIQSMVGINWTNDKEVQTLDSIDGKPIYKRYVEGNFNGTSNVTLATGVDKYLDAQLTVLRASASQWHRANAHIMPHAGGDSIPEHIDCVFQQGDKIKTYCTNTTFETAAFRGFIYYTKV